MLQNTKKLLVGLCALTALGQFSLPALAEMANVQESTQVTTQDGKGHTSFQRGTQQIRHNSRGEMDAQGNVQSIYQDVMQTGKDNYGQQEMEQRINVRRGGRRGPTEVEVQQ